MGTEPWTDDACSLVEAFRAGTLTPLEALDACLDAIESSAIAAFSFVDADGARAAARRADTSLPLGGVPVAVKELEEVEGWPHTQASLAFADRRATHDGVIVERLRAAGAVLVGLTTASEFGGLNISRSKLNGITGNPWDPERTAGGSSGGSAAAVAGGLVPIATGGDGGGSIRIPAGFCGLPGLKATYGRIPRWPAGNVYPMTAVLGCLARSVRDIARWFDVTNGFDARDPYSLPRVDGWEAGLGSHDLAGLRVAIAPDLGAAVVRPEVEAVVREAAAALVEESGLQVVDLPIEAPKVSAEWALANTACDVLVELGDAWPACKEVLTPQIAWIIDVTKRAYDADMAARVERQRTAANRYLAEVFESVDLVISATNPDVAFPAQVAVNLKVGDVDVGPENNGALTIPANIVGNPAISVPAGTVDGLPVGMQVMAAHHAEPLLLDVALAVERARPWPLVAPGAPA